MKVRIRKYPTWLGPYQLVEKLCFWAKKDELGQEPDWVFNLGDKLAHSWAGDYISRAAQAWIDFHSKRQVKIQIDPWDTWSMDHTLANIVLPMLVQLKRTKHGAPNVDLNDVPKELRPTKKEIDNYKQDGTTDPKFFERWDYVLDEMIFAFASKVDDSWEDQFHSGTHDVQWKEVEDGFREMVRGPNDTYKFDKKGHSKYHARIQNGFRLFGKYYENLWD